MWNIFDQPWTLAITAGVVFLIIWVIRIFIPEKMKKRFFILPVFVLISAFAFDILVKTDIEKITSTVMKSIQAVEDENPEALGILISEKYKDSFHGSKQRLMLHAHTVLQPPLVAKNVTSIISMEKSKTEAKVVLTVRIKFDENSTPGQLRPFMFVKAEFVLRKEQFGNWLINRIELLEIDRQPVMWKQINY